MIQKIFYTIPKIIWFLFCIITSMVLACVSGYFTFRFYTDGTKGLDMYTMGMLAISLEFIKFIFSVAFPFAKNRNKKSEDTIFLVMKICLVLSILSSMYCLLLGKDIINSPASATITMLYEYMPFLGIIPLKFSQFLGTVSLTVLIEFIIVFLPTISLLMFSPKESNRKTYAITNLDKLKEIVVIIPELLIDRLYQRVMNYAKLINTANNKTDNVIELKEVRTQKPELKLIKNEGMLQIENPSNVDWEKPLENENLSNSLINGNDNSKLFPEKLTGDNIESTLKPMDTEEEKTCDLFPEKNTGIDKTEKINLLNAIYKLMINNNCPSIKQLTIYTGYNKNLICAIKKEFEDMGILKTDGTKTYVLCGCNEAMEKLEA